MLIFPLVAAKFLFYIYPQDFPSLGPVETSRPITLRWTWDSCAGSRDAVGRPIKATSINGQCVDSSGHVVMVETLAVFPRGLDTMILRQGFGSGKQQTNLLSGITNDNAFAGSGLITIPSLSGFPSDYYTLVMSATDADGELVSGQSQYFAIKNSDPLPPLNKITLVTPMQSAYWLAGAQYRLRWSVENTAIPDRFHIDLLSSGGHLLQRIKESTAPLANDTLLGPMTRLNYTVWTVPPELAFNQFRIRITGVYSDANGQSSNVTDPPVTTSPVFFIGPSI